MNERKYGWRFPIPRGQFNLRDILIFNTYAFALAIWPWIIHAMIYPVDGAPQGFVMIFMLPFAMIATVFYTLFCFWRKRDVNIWVKLLAFIMAFFLPFSVFISAYVINLIGGGIFSYLIYSMISTCFGFLLLLWILPSFFMGLGFMIVLPILGYQGKK